MNSHLYSSKKHSNGFTIVEIVTAIVLTSVFIGMIIMTIGFYNTVHTKSKKRAAAYSIARQLSKNISGISTDSIGCTANRQTISNEQPIENLETYNPTENLINPTVSVYAEYINDPSCEEQPRIIISVQYGPDEDRNNIESIASR